jgi:hypothetical protein
MYALLLNSFSLRGTENKFIFALGGTTSVEKETVKVIQLI